MFCRSHSTSIDIHVGVNLDRCDFQAQCLQEQSGGGGYVASRTPA